MSGSSNTSKGPRGEAPLGQLLEGVLAGLDLGARFREHLAAMAWPEIAGRAVGAHTRVEAVRDGVLIVATDTPAWAQELQMRERELIQQLSRRVGSGVIREVHFRTGIPRRAGATGTAARATRRAGNRRPSEVQVSRRQERQIRQLASRIEDADLRERAERAFLALARMAEWRKRGGWRRCRRCGQWQRLGRRWCSSCTHSGDWSGGG